MKLLITISVFLFGLKSVAQTPETVRMCQTSEVMNAFYEGNTKAQIERANFETFTAKFAEQKNASKSAAGCYVIPVVFHVYGTSQGGKTVNNSIIINALNGTNDDFHGMNADYATVHNSF